MSKFLRRKNRKFLCRRPHKPTLKTFTESDRLYKWRSIPSECHGCMSQDGTKKASGHGLRFNALLAASSWSSGHYGCPVAAGAIKGRPKPWVSAPFWFFFVGTRRRNSGPTELPKIKFQFNFPITNPYKPLTDHSDTDAYL